MIYIRSPFLFRTTSMWTPESDQEVSSKAAARTWIHYAYHGSPGAEYKPYTRDDPKWLLLGPEKGEIRQTPMNAENGWEEDKMQCWIEALENGDAKIFADGRGEMLPDIPTAWPRLGDSK